MATPPNVKRLRVEDFDSEQRELVERLSYSINDFLDQVVFLFTKGIDFRNLNQQIVTVSAKTNSTGSLVEAVTIKTDLKTKVVGGMIIDIINNTNSRNLPTYYPFAKIEPKSNTEAKLSSIGGLEPNSDYSVKILLIGENI